MNAFVDMCEFIVFWGQHTSVQSYGYVIVPYFIILKIYIMNNEQQVMNTKLIEVNLLILIWKIS